MTSILPTDQTIASALKAELPEVEAAWLFGSAAKGHWRAGSDIDLAVRLPAALTAEQKREVGHRLGERLGIDVDLLDFLRLDTVMQVQLLDTGRLLFARDAAAEMQYGAFLHTEYQHMQRWRVPMMRALAERLAATGGGV